MLVRGAEIEVEVSRGGMIEEHGMEEGGGRGAVSGGV